MPPFFGSYSLEFHVRRMKALDHLVDEGGHQHDSQSGLRPGTRILDGHLAKSKNVGNRRICSPLDGIRDLSLSLSQRVKREAVCKRKALQWYF
jgi:hypothetical protein